MKTKTAKTRTRNPKKDYLEEDDIEGYPVYPPTEDIYDNYEKADDEDPEVPDSVRRRTSHKIVERLLTDEDDPENALDVPGSELDDDQEIVGSEDEENNYYSLGGDEHNNLEEDNLD